MRQKQAVIHLQEIAARKAAAATPDDILMKSDTVLANWLNWP
jgi:hypothetical protein